MTARGVTWQAFVNGVSLSRCFRFAIVERTHGYTLIDNETKELNRTTTLVMARAVADTRIGHFTSIHRTAKTGLIRCEVSA